MTNFPSGISSQGIPIMPGIPLATGTFFFVSSVSGSDNNTGRDKTHPLATIAKAITLCTAAKGDVILLMPGHAESIVAATGFNLSVSGVQVVGLGSGLLRPTFTYTTANTATFTVSAANVSITNCHFVANFLNVAAALTLTTAKDCAITNCTFVDTSSILNFTGVVAATGAANTADGFIFSNNYVLGLCAADLSVVTIAGATVRLQINDNVVDKSAATADVGHLVTLTAGAHVGIRVLRNCLTLIALAAQTVGTLGVSTGTASSGMVADNYVALGETTTNILWTASTKISFNQNFGTGAADKSGVVWPAADNPA